MTTFFIIGGMVAFMAVYFIFILPKISKKYENQQANMLGAIKGKEAQLKTEYLNDPTKLKLIADLMPGEKVVGIASSMQKRDIKDVLKDGAFNMAGKVLGKATGVELSKGNNNDIYFVALTDIMIHYFVFEDGNCIEHLKYEKTKSKNIRLEDTKIKDNYVGGSSGGTKNLLFEYEMKTQSFYLYPFFTAFPQGTLYEGIGKVSEAGVFASELFTKPLLNIRL